MDAKSRREKVLDSLIDSADRTLRSGRKLTAAEVSSAAGIARNSIYRYVDSVDDLRGLVLALSACLGGIDRQGIGGRYRSD